MLKASTNYSSHLSGTVLIPGDKSISHRALMMGAISIGKTIIRGLLEGEDVLDTAKALSALGAKIERLGVGHYEVIGTGVGGLRQPDTVLDMGNSGTGVRLLMGLVSSYPFLTFFTGDQSLRSRPMGRVIDPLSLCGAQFSYRDNKLLPLSVRGIEDALPIHYELPVASAQVKSAILFSALNIDGISTVEEHSETRDHTEIMFKEFGVDLNIEELSEKSRRIEVKGYPELVGRELSVPSDPSSAAFLMVAASLVENSHLTLPNICLNPRRTGLLETLLEMKADIEIINKRHQCGELVGDISVKTSTLKAVDVPADRAVRMIDEYPVLAIAAACAEGKTILRGLEELRVKESDRFSAILEGLKASSVKVEAVGNDIIIEGNGKAPKAGVTVKSYYDHRIAMAFLILGMVAKDGIQIDDITAIKTSYPNFLSTLKDLDVKINYCVNE